MDKFQSVSFANKMVEVLEASSKGIISKLERDSNYRVFKCKIKGNTNVQFDLSLHDISGTAEYHVFKREDHNLVSQTYRLSIKNAGAEKSVSATNQDKSKANQDAEVFNALERLFNAIIQANEKNLDADLSDIISS